MAVANRSAAWPDTAQIMETIENRFQSLRADLIEEDAPESVLNVHAASVKQARRFLEKIALDMTVPPFIGAADSGLVELFWKPKPGYVLSIRFHTDGRVSYGFVEPDKEKSAIRDGVCSIEYLLEKENGDIISYVNAANQHTGALREPIEMPERNTIGVSTENQEQRTFIISGMVGAALSIYISRTADSSSANIRQSAEQGGKRVHPRIPG